MKTFYGKKLTGTSPFFASNSAAIIELLVKRSNVIIAKNKDKISIEGIDKNMHDELQPEEKTPLSERHRERIIGLSSLSGVRGRKSNFIYGSSKAAFTQYLAGLRQYLFPRKIVVNVIVAGYIRSKMTAGLDLPESLLMEPAFIARAVVGAGRGFTIVPGFKWKLIYLVLKLLPENLVAKLP